MGFHPNDWDILVPGTYGGPINVLGPKAKIGTKDVADAIVAAVAGTEIIAYDTSMIVEAMACLMDKALWGNGSSTATSKTIRQAASHIKRLFMSVVADQELSIYQRHLARNDSTWRAFGDNQSPSVSPTVVPANTPTLLTLPFFGDDHQVSIKATVAPSFVALSIRVSADQALAE